MSESQPTRITNTTLVSWGVMVTVALLFWNARGEVLDLLDKVDQKYVTKEVFSLRMDAMEERVRTIDTKLDELLSRTPPREGARDDKALRASK